MNCRKILFIVGAVLVFLIMSFIVLSIRIPKYNRPAVFVPNISFGMSQNEVKDILGCPKEITNNPHNSQDNTYFYELDVADHKADVYLTFKKIALCNQLYSISIDFKEIADTGTYAQALINMIKNEYQQEEGYYISQHTAKNNSTNYTSLGVQNGAVGVNFTVNVSKSTISVHSVCDEYDG